jgi:uncharacterized protein (TIGR00730 family)
VEVSGASVGEVRVVPDMHARKAAMASASDAFIALPGGFGTLEETMEMITWQQLGFSSKPVGLLNTAGFYDGLLQFFDHAVAQGFIRGGGRAVLVTATSPGALLDALEAYEVPKGIIALAHEHAAVRGGAPPPDAAPEAFL